MRAEILNYLYCGLDKLHKVGPKTVSNLTRLLATYPHFPQLQQPPRYYLVDLLYHLPVNILDRTYSPALSAAIDKSLATLIVTPTHYILPKTPRQPYRIVCSNQTGELTIILFKIFGNAYLNTAFPLNQRIVVSGKLEAGLQGWQMTHPDLIAPISKLAEIRRIQPVYPAVAGVTQKLIANSINSILDQLPELPEWIPAATLAQHHWLSWKETLIHLHQQLTGLADLAEDSPYLQRLAYDELLATQLAFQLTKLQFATQTGAQIPINLQDSNSYRNQLLYSLPFQLTTGQQQALQELETDLASEKRMLRLLQGDVGSGKTIVALLAMLSVVDQGQQAAIIAPLSILAAQHFQTFQSLCAPLGIRIGLLTSKITGKQRKNLLQQLQNGELDILVGTHSLFQESVVFKQLSLIVIDEQHRFGVLQRLNTANKGQHANILLMTATPIPRTLLLSMYGDLAVSTLPDKPQQRKPIHTAIMNDSQLPEIYRGLQRVIRQGHKIFWICPLISEDTAASDTKTTTALRTTALQQQFGSELVLSLHGKLKTADKETIMERFANPQDPARILVATTVVEVGIDIPQATVIIIENADTFGLAQLHQLRGRVGRGNQTSYCILLHRAKLHNLAKQRLEALKSHDDGFAIAELDLQLRGSGKIFGVNQSGYTPGLINQLANQRELIEQAHLQAQQIVTEDPTLSQPQHQAQQLLLQLLRYDGCLNLLPGG